jgi:hypothetical protein
VPGYVGDIASDNVSTTEQSALVSYIGDALKQDRDNGAPAGAKYIPVGTLWTLLRKFGMKPLVA